MVVTATTWSASVAWRMPRKKPRTRTAISVICLNRAQSHALRPEHAARAPTAVPRKGPRLAGSRLRVHSRSGHDRSARLSQGPDHGLVRGGRDHGALSAVKAAGRARLHSGGV